MTSLNPLLEPIRSTTYEVGMKRILVFGVEQQRLVECMPSPGILFPRQARKEDVRQRERPVLHESPHGDSFVVCGPVAVSGLT